MLAVAFFAVAAINYKHPLVASVLALVGAVLASLSAFAPQRLKRITVLWFRLSLLLHRVVNPVVMFLIFVVVFVPAGLLMRIWRDPLLAKRDKTATTYWIDCVAEDKNPTSMNNQF
ncbi:MAG: hypothetical protein NTZ72_14610 [Afipia sp.]|nr:hypothetical protein [Afipia sp.]